MAALHLAEHRGEPDAVMHIGAAGRRIGVAVEAVRLRLESAEEMERAGKARA